MGSLSALDMAEQVGEGNIQIRTALSWHLQSNHYPPHPAFMIDPALAAIEHVNSGGSWGDDIDLPLGCETHGVLIPYGFEECQGIEDHASCVSAPAVNWQDREDGKVRVQDIVESFHLDSFIDDDI